jgi:hypothetical protein
METKPDGKCGSCLIHIRTNLNLLNTANDVPYQSNLVTTYVVKSLQRIEVSLDLLEIGERNLGGHVDVVFVIFAVLVVF